MYKAELTQGGLDSGADMTRYHPYLESGERFRTKLLQQSDPFGALCLINVSHFNATPKHRGQRH